MVFHNLEFIDLIKKNLFKIFIGTIFLTISYVVLMDFFFPRDGISIMDNIHLEIEDNPAHFYFYIEEIDGTPFTNEPQLEEIILTSDIFNQDRDNTGIDFSTLLKSYENIKLSIDNASYLYELNVNIGDEEQNMFLSNYYYNMIRKQALPILENKNVYMFNKPKIKNIENEQKILKEQRLEKKQNVILANITVGIGLSLPVLLIFIIIRATFSKKIESSLSYSIKDKDTFVLIDKRLKNYDEINHLLSIPRGTPKIIIQENDIDLLQGMDVNISEVKNEIKRVNSIKDVSKTDEIGNVILLIKKGVTTREWYKAQSEISEKYGLPLYVVQIN